MAKQISVKQARQNLKSCAKGIASIDEEITLANAKERLRLLDSQLDLPPITTAIEQRRFSDALMLTLTWSVSTEGLKLIYPLLKKSIALKLFK